MSSLLRPTPSVIAALLVALVCGCSSSNDSKSRTNVTSAGGSPGSDAGPRASGGNGSGSGGATGTGGLSGTGGLGGEGGKDSGANQSSRDGGACAFSTAPPPAPAPDPHASQEAQAKATGLRTLDALIGRYVRGEATVYSGTAKAHDNRSALVNSVVYGPYPDGVIPEGRALAQLEVRPSTDNDWSPPDRNPTGTSAVLVVHGLPPDQHVIVEQHSIEPGVTLVSLLSGVATTTSMSTSCRNCAPDLFAKPGAISFTNLTATGPMTVYMGYTYDGGHDVNVTATVTASVDLALLPPCALTFDDLVVLESATGPNEIDATLGSFQNKGTEMVYESGGSFTVGGTPQCPLVQTYSIELYVEQSDLGHYGARNFVAATPAVMCVPGKP